MPYNKNMKGKKLQEYLKNHSKIMNAARNKKLSSKQKTEIALKGGWANRKRLELIRENKNIKNVQKIRKNP